MVSVFFLFTPILGEDSHFYRIFFQVGRWWYSFQILWIVTILAGFGGKMWVELIGGRIRFVGQCKGGWCILLGWKKSDSFTITLQITSKPPFLTENNAATEILALGPTSYVPLASSCHLGALCWNLPWILVFWPVRHVWPREVTSRIID